LPFNSREGLATDESIGYLEDRHGKASRVAFLGLRRGPISLCSLGTGEGVKIKELHRVLIVAITCEGAEMTEQIPEDVIQFAREIFAGANSEAPMALARQPAAHEEHLDFQIFAALDRVGPRILPSSNAAIEIDTHWLGGRRYYGGRWEIADIGIVVVLRRGGNLLWRKVALLQSKRLYSREIPVVELDRSDYEIGIGRLVDQTEPIIARTTPRTFEFTSECVYGAMTVASKQVTLIEDYIHKRHMPVYYSLYNPPRMPYQGTVPRAAAFPLEQEETALGCRVMTAQDVHAALARLPVGRTPQFRELTVANPTTSSDEQYSDHGWRLESFVADEVLRCRHGRLFEQDQDRDLHALLYERTAPIASLIQISVDLPAD
jgi:hypothetical protein